MQDRPRAKWPNIYDVRCYPQPTGKPKSRGRIVTIGTRKKAGHAVTREVFQKGPRIDASFYLEAVDFPLPAALWSATRRSDSSADSLLRYVSHKATLRTSMVAEKHPSCLYLLGRRGTVLPDSLGTAFSLVLMQSCRHLSPTMHPLRPTHSLRMSW